MSDYSYIPIQKELIPYQFDITLNGRTFTFFMRYNAEHDFFTIDLFRGDELIVAGKRLYMVGFYFLISNTWMSLG